MEFHFEKESWTEKSWTVNDDGITHGNNFYSLNDIAKVEVMVFMGQGQFHVTLLNGRSTVFAFKKKQLAQAESAKQEIDQLLEDLHRVLIDGQYVVHCKSCNKLSFYTPNDIEVNKRKVTNGMFDSLSIIGEFLGGSKESEEGVNGIRNFTKCPYCGSKDIEYFNESDLEKYNNGTFTNKENTSDSIEEIKRYKELLDQDIITEEEFQKKKKELLGL